MPTYERLTLYVSPTDSEHRGYYEAAKQGNLVVQRLEGRGDVLVIEQPTSRNNYTATLRIRDPRGGAARYRIVAYWEPPVRYGYGR